MPKNRHTGYTSSGSVKDTKVERIRRVTIYRRGDVYYLYYRENGNSIRRPVEGSLNTARATASKIAVAMDEGRPSPLGFLRTSPADLITQYLSYTKEVQGLASRSQDRYRAALERFQDFTAEQEIQTVDSVTEATVEDFVRWLRQQKRSRNGHENATMQGYKIGGIKFILSTVRTAFNWGKKRRFFAPFAENPFSLFPIEKLKSPHEESSAGQILSPAEELKFFGACDPWQRRIFLTLVTYGMRVGELTHLLIEDVNLEAGTLHIRSKPHLFWRVKTGRERMLPVFEEMKPLLIEAIGARKAGFVFLNKGEGAGKSTLKSILTPKAFQDHLKQVAAGVGPEATEKQQRRSVVEFCRSVGQIPEKRIRDEFMKVTVKIGREDLTRAHDLRHLFSSRAQEMGLNPLLVQEFLGHKSLEMTRRYTHVGLEAKSKELARAATPLLKINHAQQKAENVLRA